VSRALPAWPLPLQGYKVLAFGVVEQWSAPRLENPRASGVRSSSKREH